MSGRVTLADVIATQERLIEAQREQTDRLAGMLSAALAALTERREKAETVALKRGTVGEKPTGVDVEVATRDGETLEQAAERGRVTFEALCARFPLPSGVAHAAELGPWPGAE